MNMPIYHDTTNIKPEKLTPNPPSPHLVLYVPEL